MPVTWINPFSKFNPLDLTPVLWFDADDASTITSSSGNVSQWNDKSGNAYHVTQSTGTAQPKTGTMTRNGRNVIDFDGTDDRLIRDIANGLGRNVSGLTIYVVVSVDAVAGNIVNIATGTSSTSARASATFNASTQYTSGGRTLDSNTSVSVSSSALSTGTWYANCSVFDYANTDLNLYVNRTADGSTTSFQTATTTSNTDSLRLTIASGLAGGTVLNGQIAEIVVFHSAHGSSNRTLMFDYLSQKWGV